jgi:hypothetical protein
MNRDDRNMLYLRTRETLQVKDFAELALVWADNSDNEYYDPTRLSSGEDFDLHRRVRRTRDGGDVIEIELYCESEHSQGCSVDVKQFIADYNAWIKGREEVILEILRSDEYQNFPIEKYQDLYERYYDYEYDSETKKKVYNGPWTEDDKREHDELGNKFDNLASVFWENDLSLREFMSYMYEGELEEIEDDY